jgi:hypothetical protein
MCSHSTATSGACGERSPGRTTRRCRLAEALGVVPVFGNPFDLDAPLAAVKRLTG